VNLVVGVVVSEPGEHFVGALSVRLCLVGAPQTVEVGRGVLGAVDHQTVALAVVRVEQYDALVLIAAVDVCHYIIIDSPVSSAVTRTV